MPVPPAPWSRPLGFMLMLVLFVAAAPAARADDGAPGRVGRLADFSGEVSMFDHEQGSWAPTLRNRPLTSGDRLSTPRDGHAELRIGSTTVRLGAATEFELIRLDDDRLHFQLHSGSLALRVRSREVAAEIEIETTEARLRPLRGGHFRIDREDDTTHAASWRGELLVEAGAESFEVDSGRRVELWREGPMRVLRHAWTTTPDDRFAEWALREDRQDDRSVSARYLSPETTGIEDLDRHGRWDMHPEYGAIWYPLVVAVDWAPYRFGHWAWVRPWGWTWVDDARWGFAPFHYGRWVHWRSRWCWVPGPIMARPVFAPALVAWIGGPRVGVSISIGGPTLGWVPLAPFESYRPYYPVAPRHRDHYTPNPGRGGTPDRGHVPTGPVMYTNQGVPGGITVVPASVLEQPRQQVPVGRHALRDEKVMRELRRQPLLPTPPLVHPPGPARPYSRPAPAALAPAPDLALPAPPRERTLVEPVPRRPRLDPEHPAPRSREPAEARPSRPQPSDRPAAPAAPTVAPVVTAPEAAAPAAPRAAMPRPRTLPPPMTVPQMQAPHTQAPQMQAPQMPAPQMTPAQPPAPQPPIRQVPPPQMQAPRPAPAQAQMPPAPPPAGTAPAPGKHDAPRPLPEARPPTPKAKEPAPEEGRGKPPMRERQQLN